MKNEHRHDSSWIVSLDSSGGITGHGVGRIRIVSDGSVAAASGPEEITSTLSPDERQQLEQAISAADISRWSRGVDDRGADQITYELHLERGDSRADAAWMDGTVSEAPADARQIADIAWRIHRRVWNDARE